MSFSFTKIENMIVPVSDEKDQYFSGSQGRFSKPYTVAAKKDDHVGKAAAPPVEKTGS